MMAGECQIKCSQKRPTGLVRRQASRRRVAVSGVAVIVLTRNIEQRDIVTSERFIEPNVKYIKS